MTTKTRAATIGTLAAAMAILLAYSAFIAPAFAQAATSTSTTTSTSSTAQGSTTATSTNCANVQSGQLGAQFIAGPQAQGWPTRGGPFGPQTEVNLTVGQTITVTSTSGEYVAVSNHDENGTATGTMTFTVTGKLAGGFTLSISSGSLVVNGTTYTVSSGSAQMDRSASQLEGQGATSSSGVFLVRASAHGSFAGTTATMSLDLSNGSTEYLVLLSGTIQG